MGATQSSVPVSSKPLEQPKIPQASNISAHENTTASLPIRLPNFLFKEKMTNIIAFYYFLFCSNIILLTASMAGKVMTYELCYSFVCLYIIYVNEFFSTFTRHYNIIFYYKIF